ncbi:hypothetical protein LXL04_005146 [Taraxacum kok-saghyz]
MNSENHHNDSSISNADLNTRRHQPRKRDRDRQLQQQYSSAATGNDNGSPARRMEETATVAEVSRVEDTISSLYFIPVGYRFFPTDRELIKYYLMKKIKNEVIPENKIIDVDIYQNHPDKIVENHPEVTEGHWYFFSSRNRKYTNGTRSARTAGPGYWKATGKVKKVLDDDGTVIGFKSSLDYRVGKQPNGIKTNWLMKEYVVEGHKRQRLDKKDMKLDDYVLYKMYKTKSKENGEKEQVVTSNTEDEHLIACDPNQDQNATINRKKRRPEPLQIPAPYQPVLLSNDESVPKQTVLPNHDPLTISNEPIFSPRTISYLNEIISINMTYAPSGVHPAVPATTHYYSGDIYSVLPTDRICYDATMGFNGSDPQPIQMTPLAYDVAHTTPSMVMTHIGECPTTQYHFTHTLSPSLFPTLSLSLSLSLPPTADAPPTTETLTADIPASTAPYVFPPASISAQPRRPPLLLLLVPCYTLAPGIETIQPSSRQPHLQPPSTEILQHPLFLLRFRRACFDVQPHLLKKHKDVKAQLPNLHEIVKMEMVHWLDVGGHQYCKNRNDRNVLQLSVI